MHGQSAALLAFSEQQQKKRTKQHCGKEVILLVTQKVIKEQLEISFLPGIFLSRYVPEENTSNVLSRYSVEVPSPYLLGKSHLTFLQMSAFLPYHALMLWIYRWIYREVRVQKCSRLSINWYGISVEEWTPKHFQPLPRHSSIWKTDSWTQPACTSAFLRQRTFADCTWSIYKQLH